MNILKGLSKNQRLRVKRVSMGKTLEHMAEKTGLSLGMLSLLELGQRICSKKTAYKIAKAYGVRISDVPHSK